MFLLVSIIQNYSLYKLLPLYFVYTLFFVITSIEIVLNYISILIFIKSFYLYFCPDSELIAFLTSLLKDVIGISNFRFQNRTPDLSV